MCQYCAEREIEGKFLKALKRKQVAGKQVTLWEIMTGISPGYRVTIEIPKPGVYMHYTRSKDGRYHRKIEADQYSHDRALLSYDNITSEILKLALELWKKYDDFYRTKRQLNTALRMSRLMRR